MMIICHLLDVLQWNSVRTQLLVDEDERIEVTHPTVEELVRHPARAFYGSLLILQQSARGEYESETPLNKPLWQFVMVCMTIPKSN